MILLLHLRFKVNQDVAATDQVHPGKGGVGDQVLSRKRHCFAQLLADLPGGFVHPREKAGQPFRRDIGGDALGIDSAAGNVERVFIDIRSEDLQAAGFWGRRLMFEQQHGEGIRLFTCCATGNPDAQRCVGILCLDERGDDFRRQSAECVRVAEETGHPYQEIASEPLDLFGMFSQVGEVFRDVIEVAQSHAPCQPPPERFLAITVKIELGAGTQESEHLVQMILILADRGDDRAPALCGRGART